MQAEPIDRGRIGWAVKFTDDDGREFISAMPDKRTAYLTACTSLVMRQPRKRTQCSLIQAKCRPSGSKLTSCVAKPWLVSRSGRKQHEPH